MSKREYNIHPVHEELLSSIVIDRRINEEELLEKIKTQLTKYKDLTDQDFAEFHTNSGFTPQEMLFAVSFLRAIQDCYSPSPQYFDRILDQTVRWLNTRSTMNASRNEAPVGRYLGRLSKKTPNNPQATKLELKIATSLLKILKQ